MLMVPRSKLWIFPEKSEAGSVIPEVTGLRCAGLTAVTWGSSQVGGLLCYGNPRALHPCGLWGQPWCHTIASTHPPGCVGAAQFVPGLQRPQPSW